MRLLPRPSRPSVSQNPFRLVTVPGTREVLSGFFLTPPPALRKVFSTRDILGAPGLQLARRIGPLGPVAEDNDSYFWAESPPLFVISSR